MPNDHGDPSAIQAADQILAAFLALDIPSGEQIYDFIMGQIEPELMSKELPHLEQRYKHEKKKQAKARAKRYQAAFAEYDKRFAEYTDWMNQKVHAFQRFARQTTERFESKKERGQIDDLESGFSDA
jgi:hypothetical protein